MKVNCYALAYNQEDRWRCCYTSDSLLTGIASLLPPYVELLQVDDIRMFWFLASLDTHLDLVKIHILLE